MSNKEKVPVSFSWPKSLYNDINEMASELELTFQKFVIMTMKQKVSRLTKKNDLNN